MGLWGDFTAGIGSALKGLTGGSPYLSEEEKAKAAGLK